MELGFCFVEAEMFFPDGGTTSYSLRCREEADEFPSLLYIGLPMRSPRDGVKSFLSIPPGCSRVGSLEAMSELQNRKVRVETRQTELVRLVSQNPSSDYLGVSNFCEPRIGHCRG